MKAFRELFLITLNYFGKKFYVIILLNLLAVAAESFGLLLMIPLLKQLFFDSATSDPISSTIYHVLYRLNLPITTVSVLALIVMAFSLKGVVVFAISIYRRINLNKIRREIRERLVQQFAGVDYQYSLRKSRGYFGHLLAVDIDRASWTMGNYCLCLTSLMTSSFLMLIAVLMQPQLTSAIVIAGCINVLVLRFTARLAKRYSKSQSQLGAQLNGFFLEVLQSFKYLKSTASFSALTRQTQRANRDLAAVENKLSVADAVVDSVREPLLVLLVAGVIYYHVVFHASNVAPIIAALGLLYRCMMEFGFFQSYWQLVCSSFGGLENLYQADRQLNEHQERLSGGLAPRFDSEIRLRNVSFAYQTEQVLHEIDLTIPCKTSAAIVGSSGAGKTTLVNLITGILRPDTGEVLLDGVNLNEIDIQAYRKRIGYVTQEATVFRDTIANNISMRLGAECDELTMDRIRTVAELSKCDEFIDRMPERYNTLVVDCGKSLSAGQLQRLMIARELFRGPEILILDESTSSLDSVSEECILQSLQSLRGTMTIVVISHRFSAIRGVDQVFVVEAGSIVESGSIEELLMSQESRFSQLSELQKLVVG